MGFNLALFWALGIHPAAAAQPQPVTVSGANISRTLAVKQGRLRTESVSNHLTGRVLRTAGPEFALTRADGKDATSDDFQVRALERKDAGASAVLESAPLGLEAEITYTPAANNQPWLHKQIRFTNVGSKPFLLRTVDLEHMTVTDEAVTYTVDPAIFTRTNTRRSESVAVWGQPVYTDSLWFGVEFPASRNAATPDGVVILRHHPGVEFSPGQSYTTRRAVLGAARPGHVAEAFLDYVATITPRENPPHAHIYWNGFRVIKPPDRTAQGLEMIRYAEKLKRRTGFVFDGWTYDAGFNMYRPDALFVPNEPTIWSRTAEALKPLGIPLGIWCSFSCIFDTPTHAWGKTRGYELQHDRSYCLAGPRYYAAIKSRLEEIVRTHRIGSINFDGMYWGQGFGCNQPGHGHLVGTGAEAGLYATQRVVEHKLDIFRALRAINPDIVLDLFVCNEWASPWWLMQLDGVHTVAGDTLGCDIPSPWLRDELITVRDIQVYDEHRRLKRRFPLWAEDLYGTQVRADHLIDGITVQGEEMARRWEDEFVMALPGRGAISNSIVCCDLAVLDKSPAGLDFLGQVGNWVRRNQRIYRDFRLIGGQPARRQPYGYAHSDHRGRAIVALRNPWIEPRTFQLAIDQEIGLEQTAEPVFVNVVYPYYKTFAQARFGQAVEIPLQDYQVLLIEVRTESRQLPSARTATRWTRQPDGRVALCDESVLTDLPAGGLTATTGPGHVRITGKLRVPPPPSGGQLQLMTVPQHGHLEGPIVRVNDKEAVFRYHHRTRGAGRIDAWTLVDLPSGESSVDITLSGPRSVSLGGWLVATYTLPAHPTNQTAAPGDDDDLFPALTPQEDRRVATVLSPRTLALPLGPIRPGESVPLADLRVRCLESRVGYMRFGWDQSCWPEDPVLRIGDKTFTTGLGVHAPAVAVFDINGQFKRFHARVGLHGVGPDKKADKRKFGSCVFIVEGDGRTLATSPLLREGDRPHEIDADVTGVKILTLRTTNGGDSNWDDLATWADARLRR